MIDFIRIPLTVALYLVFRVIRAYEAKQILLRHGMTARGLYLSETPATFAAFRGKNG